MAHIGQRKSVAIHYKDYTSSKEVDMVEVCEWENGEGYDITLNNQTIIPITLSEWDAIALAICTLRVQEQV